MGSYILRDIEPELWARVKERARREGKPVRWVILNLLRQYARVRQVPAPPRREIPPVTSSH
jgi:hypothetical protein